MFWRRQLPCRRAGTGHEKTTAHWGRLCPGYQLRMNVQEADQDCKRALHPSTSFGSNTSGKSVDGAGAPANT